MRVLLFIDNLGAGGAQRQFCGLASLLKQHGYTVKVITNYADSFYLPLLREGDIDYECLNKNSYYCLPTLMKSLKGFKPNIAISFQTTPNFLACIACSFLCIPLVVSERNTHINISIKDRVIVNFYRLADFVVPNSYSEKSYLVKHFSFLKNKIQTISNFVDLKKFAYHNRTFRRANKVVLVVASVRASKNTKGFIEACRIAIEAGCTSQFIWYGVNPTASEYSSDNMYTQECLDLIKSYKLSGQILLLDKRIDIENAYQDADIFCLPSFFEGTPNVICEAMASGLPVVCSSVCDNPIYVKNNDNGLLFNPHDVQNMAEVLLKISMMDNVTLSKWGAKSRQIVENRCNEQSFVEKYIDLIKRFAK